AQSSDKLPKVNSAMRDVNRTVITNGGSARFQPVKQGGHGGTWANIEVLQAFHAVPEYNFRPRGGKEVEGLFRRNVEKDFEIISEACFRCGIRCHNNIFERNPDGSKGKLAAKYDFEPLILFGSNLGINDGGQVAELIHLCDYMGMDAISLGTT